MARELGKEQEPIGGQKGLVEKLLQKYPPEPLMREEGRDPKVLREKWDRLRYASEVARRKGQHEDSHVCRCLAELSWDVDKKNPERAFWDLRDLVRELDPEREYRSLLGLGCLLMRIYRRNIEPGGEISFYDEKARKRALGNPDYARLVRPLLNLQGKKLGDPTISQVREKIREVKTDSSLEKGVVMLLLQNLQEKE